MLGVLGVSELVPPEVVLPEVLPLEVEPPDVVLPEAEPPEPSGLVPLEAEPSLPASPSGSGAGAGVGVDADCVPDSGWISGSTPAPASEFSPVLAERASAVA